MTQEVTLIEYFKLSLEQQKEFATQSKVRLELARDYLKRVKNINGFITLRLFFEAERRRLNTPNTPFISITEIIKKYAFKELIHLIKTDLINFVREEGLKTSVAVKEDKLKGNTFLKNFSATWMLSVDTELKLVHSNERPLVSKHLDEVVVGGARMTEGVYHTDTLAEKLQAEEDYMAAMRGEAEAAHADYKKWNKNCIDECDWVQD